MIKKLKLPCTSCGKLTRTRHLTKMGLCYVCSKRLKTPIILPLSADYKVKKAYERLKKLKTVNDHGVITVGSFFAGCKVKVEIVEE